MLIKGSCLCGEVKFQITGEAAQFYICHCAHCQKDTGSAFAANLFVNNAELEWLSGQSQVSSFNLKPTRHVKSFCANCGSALPNGSMGKGKYMVPAGCIDGEVLIKPLAHIFTESQAHWESDLTSVQSFPGFPE